MGGRKGGVKEGEGRVGGRKDKAPLPQCGTGRRSRNGGACCTGTHCNSYLEALERSSGELWSSPKPGNAPAVSCEVPRSPGTLQR